jgi:hypothetical protein
MNRSRRIILMGSVVRLGENRKMYRITLMGSVVHLGENRKMYRIVAKKLQKGQQVANLSWDENNIKMDIEEIGRDI